MSSPAVAPADDRPRRKSRRTADFWRSCSFLGPYRGLVVVSVACALLGGAVFTSGLGAMLPIFNVLLEDDLTVTDWADRQLAEKRLGVSLDDDADELRIRKVEEDGPAAAAGIRKGDAIAPAVGADSASAAIAGGSGPVPLVLSDGRAVSIDVGPRPRYVGAVRAVTTRIPAHPVGAIAVVFGAIYVLAVVGSTLRFFQEHLSEVAAIRAVNDVRRRVYDHVLHVPMSYFGLRGSSDVTSRLVQDAQGLQDGFKTVLGKAIQEPINAAMALGLSFYVSWKLTAFIVIFAPVMGILIKRFGKKMRRASRKAMEESSEMLGQVEATLAGVRVVKAAGAERFERRRYTTIMGRLVGQQVRMSRIDAISTPTLEMLTLLIVGCVVVYAAYLVKVTHDLSAAKFFLVMACLMGTAEALRKVGKINNQLQKANASAARLFEALEMPVERPRDRKAAAAEERKVKLPPIQRDVRFEDVTFTYAGANTPAVEGVDLTVPKGTSVAVVGRNGSGKTTLLALLPRFFDPQRGRVLIDGVDVRDASLPSLRRQIGVVTQESVLFPGTIAENIAYGHPLAGKLASTDPRDVELVRPLRAAVEDAARRSFAHDFIVDKPGGYDAVLDGHGGQLSGGQRQRLNIARAVLRQSPILILDEATSQVDAESEHLIQQAIEQLMQERTTFVIAHRFSTILSADTIVVMDRGRIVGQGKHDELLRTCETYQQLYERQLFVPPPPSASPAGEPVETADAV
jgi:ABC-type multidrug transport system fused ATPase/permease subunit